MARRFFSPLAGAFILAALSQTLPVSSAEVLDRVAAVVNQQIITLSDIDERLGPVRAHFDQLPAGPFRDTELNKARSSMLEQLVAEALIQQQAEQLKISASEAEVDQLVQDVLRQNRIDEAGLLRALEAQGKSLASYRDDLRFQIIRSRVVGLKVRPRVKITEEDVRNYYTQNINALKAEREIRVRHILVLLRHDAPASVTQQAMEKVMAAVNRIKSGEDFGAVAQAASDDPSRNQGGDLGYFKKGTMVPAFEEAAFALQPGELAGPIRTEYGLHVIQCLDYKEQEVKPLKEVREEIRNRLMQEELQRQLEQWIDELRQTAHIKILLDESIATK